MAKSWKEGGYSKQAIQDSIEDILKQDWNPTLSELYVLVSNWIKYGKGLFPTEKKYFEEINGAKYLNTLKSSKSANENFGYWIRRGIIILERLRSFITGYQVDYLIKNKYTQETIIIDEKKMWEILQNRHKPLDPNFKEDPSTLINTIIAESGQAANWANLKSQKQEYQLIYNRISFMENFYKRQVNILNYGTKYKTFYKKYIKNGQRETNEQFKKRMDKANTRPPLDDMPPIAEYAHLNLYGRYLMYKNSTYKAREYPVRSRKNGHYFKVLSEQLVVQTDNDKIRRLYGNKGDIFEAVVHGAANLVPMSPEKEWEIAAGDNIRYENYKVSAKVANIDNMMEENDSINYIKSGDNYFSLDKYSTERQGKIIALQTKLNSGEIAKNTTINLMIRLYFILKDYSSGGLSKEWFTKQLEKFFNYQIKNKNFVEDAVEEEAEKAITKNIKAFVQEIDI